MGIVALAIITGSAYEAQGAGVPGFLQAAQGTWLAAICLIILLQYPLIAFYVAHIVMNSSANDVARVIMALGVFFVPYIVMPFYFLVYVLPTNPPAWALKQAQPAAMA
jgi:hypothetical protein